MLNTPARSALEACFGVELAFTEAYKTYRAAHPAIREAHCLAAQFPASFLPIQEGDLFAGRICRERAGHLVDEARIRHQMAQHHAILTCEDYRTLEAMLDFWREETLQRTLILDEPHLSSEKLLRVGVTALHQEIEDQRDLAQWMGKPDARYEGWLMVLDLFKTSALYLSDQAMELAANADTPERYSELAHMYDSLVHIAQDRPRSLHQAIQLVYLHTTIIRSHSHYGRIDVYLGDFLTGDLDAGRITEDQAMNMLLSFWTMLNEKSRPVPVIRS
jgi:pyruvate-formate lyase